MQKAINNKTTPKEKIAFFRSLFKGREDVYAKRFESKKTGKSGYLPECGNEWVKGICEKPKIKCSECRHRRLLPINDNVIHWHLSGHDRYGKDFVIGLYPMLLDETCFFLAADFDKASWQEDALAFLKTCQDLNLPAALERSRSGKGGHIWLFFNEAIPAVLARKLGCHILTETMEHRPDIGMKSYDRFFPNQDTLPQGGFGNLIALPLQKKARSHGNSVFINEQMIPFEDQWEFLSSLRKIGLKEIESIVYKAEKDGRILGGHLKINEEDESTPWNRQSSKHKKVDESNLPKDLKIILSNEIYIHKKDLPPWFKNRLIRLAAFQNPEFYRAQSMRLPTHETPRIISCASDYKEYIGLPRGCLEELIKLFSEFKINFNIQEELQSGKCFDAKFLGDLRNDQKTAANALLKHDLGVLSATTAFGKTVIGAWLISERKVNTLILVHRKQLQEQWIDRLNAFLELPLGAKIGRIGGGSRKASHQIDVAIIQSLVRKGIVEEIINEYGQIIVDECHHIPAFSFEQIVQSSKAKYITGLTATVARKDGHHPIITLRCGPVRHRVDAKSQAAIRPFYHTVIVRPTGFFPLKEANSNARLQFNDLYSELITDEQRNELICQDIIQTVKQGRFPIVLTERNDHLNILYERLSSQIPNLFVLKGGMTTKKLNQITKDLTEIPDNQNRIILATGKFVGEGFDDSKLDTLFLTLPISWKGTIAQYVGRLHRNYAHKKEVIVYDYADLAVPMLERMFNRRCRGYEALGYQIQLPASAVPGWPVQVPLSADPKWKLDYSASVRRLIQDGIDQGLANLFVQSSSAIPSDAEGESRARSLVESFLYRRLETIPQTKGKFKLNAELPIAFDGWGRMEVDLLYESAKVVIEIDGSQHLSNPNAYRRDRRKDILLQENGYFVVRFLAEDISKNLNEVLDCILRILTKEKTSDESKDKLAVLY